MVGEVTERMAVVRPAKVPDDLGARIASGVVLSVLALGATWAGLLYFAALVAVVALVMNWEWSRVVRRIAFDRVVAVQHAVALTAVSASGLGYHLPALMVVACGAILVGLLCSARIGGQSDGHPVYSGLGVLYVGVPAIALIWLRGGGTAGLQAVLFVFVVVWTTDTFAYACGKLIGGPKLWPAVSPMKTWAGTLGGIGFAALAGLGFAYATGHPFPGVLALVGILLSVAAQCGDLAESALKRTFAIKHASLLIPGHGGFMDRMDGIVAAATVAALLAASRDIVDPAKALLFWP